MTTRLLTVTISVLLIATTVGLWFFGVGEMISHFLAMNWKDVPTSNVVMACLIPVVALLGLLSRWTDTNKNHDE